ncbi:MAG: trk system potassium uptake protein TrkH [Verrucomicrobiales bacterium]|jgi:trk system potassium uptake protein TrkH
MHPAILYRLLGAILTVTAAAMALCFLVAFVEAMQGRDDHAMCPMGLSCLLTAVAGGGLLFMGRQGNAEQLLRKEAIAAVVLGWILAALFGSLPFVLYHGRLTLIQAFFESMSGFTTTGSTVLTDLESLPDSILLWRSLTQWIGGLGILALIVALLSALGVNRKSLLGAETSMDLTDSPTARIKDLTLRLWAVYGGLTILCWLGLWFTAAWAGVEMSVFEALLYSLTTVSTGGFAPHDASLGHFNSFTIELFLCIFMLVSSLSMIFVVNLVTGQFHRRRGRTEALGLLIVIFLAWITITIDLWLNHTSEGWAALREAIFPVVSLSSSTGFGAGDYDQWPLFARCTLILLMAIGGCSGSTAGGIKIIRLVVMLKILVQDVRRTFRPNQVMGIKIDGRSVDSEAQRQILSYLVFVAVIVIVSTQIISMFEPSIEDLNTSFGAVFATFFNMGPGFGAVGPTDNFAHFHQSTLLYLSLLMLLGRLEIFVVVALFSRSLWRRY